MARGGAGGGAGRVTPVGDVINAIGATLAANAVVFDVIQPDGLIGFGSIVNTGGVNDMVVRETVVDKFGVTNSVEHTIPAGWDYQLDPQTYFGTPGSQSRPPFTEYKVEVRDGFAGSHTTYELHYVDVAPGSGPGSRSGPPGTWTAVASGVTGIGAGATVTLASAPLPGGPGIYVPFVAFDAPGGTPLALCQGNTLGVVPANTIYYSLEFSGGVVALVAKSAGGAPPCNLNWILYKVVP